jgi:hypothetical protein
MSTYLDLLGLQSNAVEVVPELALVTLHPMNLKNGKLVKTQAG